MRRMNPIKHIRKNVLKMKQHEFAAVAGVNQATVSRWEKGELVPSLSEMAAIRAQAQGKRGWNDRLFFEAPQGQTESAA